LRYKKKLCSSGICKLRICEQSQVDSKNCKNNICNLKNNKKCGVRFCKLTELDNTCQNTKNKICKKKCYNDFDSSKKTLNNMNRSLWRFDTSKNVSSIDLGNPMSKLKCFNNYCISYTYGIEAYHIQNKEITTMKPCTINDTNNMYSRCFIIENYDNPNFIKNKNTYNRTICRKPIDPAKFPISQKDYNTENAKFCYTVQN